MTQMNHELFKNKSPELLINLADHVADSAKELLKLEQKLAEHLGQEVALRISQVWGGQLIYFPVGKYLKTSQTHLEIFKAFNGRNHNEVAVKFGVSVQHVYQIIKQLRHNTKNNNK